MPPWWVWHQSSIEALAAEPALELCLFGMPLAIHFPLFSTHYLHTGCPTQFLLTTGGEESHCPLRPMPLRCCLKLLCWHLITWHHCVCDVTPCLPGQTCKVWLGISQAWILCLTNNYWLSNPTGILCCCLLLVLRPLGSDQGLLTWKKYSLIIKPWNKPMFKVFLCDGDFSFVFPFRILPGVVFKTLPVLRSEQNLFLIECRGSVRQGAKASQNHAL